MPSKIRRNHNPFPHNPLRGKHLGRDFTRLTPYTIFTCNA